MAEANAVTRPLQTAAAALEKANLRKVLSRIDLVLFTACAILGFDTVAASAEVGAQAITSACSRSWSCSASRSGPSARGTPAWPARPGHGGAGGAALIPFDPFKRHR